MNGRDRKRIRQLSAETGLSYQQALEQLRKEAAERAVAWKASQGETPSQTGTPKLDDPKSGNETSGT